MSTDFRALCAELVDAHNADESMSVSRWTANLTAVIARARAELSQSEPVAPTDEELARRFRAWWHDEGSGLPPLSGMDHEEHVRRISEIAWANGAYVARWGTPAIQPVPVAEPVAYLHRQGDYCDVSEIPLSEDEKARGWTETPLYSRHDLPIPNPTNQED
jgi:hypothetical protein